VLTLAALTLLAAAPLEVGVTLHPYYSWAANVTAGLPIEVRSVLPGEVDVGSYQPRPQDVAGLAGLDVLLVNGLGHDDFIGPMLKASGNTGCRVVNLNDGTALLPVHRGKGTNSHTFLSFGNAAQQSQRIARVLGEVRPYLLQELGLELVDVVQPAHGLAPSASELTALLKRLDAEPVKVVLSEEQFPPALAQVLASHGATVVVVSHVATGDFTAGRFEREMQLNVDAIVSALVR
jgi:zinc transport system substrate-binding protein